MASSEIVVYNEIHSLRLVNQWINNTFKASFIFGELFFRICFNMCKRRNVIPKKSYNLFFKSY